METAYYILYAIFSTMILFLGIIGFISSRKNKMAYGLINSIYLAFSAYYYKPNINDDLYRHHENIYYIMRLSNSELFEYFINYLEKGEVLSKIIVAKLRNVNFLQFGITFLTYILIFYLINKMTKGKKYSNSSFVISILFVIFSINYLGIISNLYFTLAITIFCVGMYKYFEEKKLKIAILLMIISFFIHSSMVVCIIIFLMFILLKNNLNFKSIIILAGIVFSVNIIIPWLYTSFNNDFTANIYRFYDAYVLDSKDISHLHSTFLMFVYYIKLLPFGLLFFVKDSENNDLNNYTKYNLLFIIMMSFLTSFSIRYIPIIQILGFPKIINYLNTNNIENKKNRVIYIMILLAIIAINVIYQYRQIITLNFN